MSAQLGDSLEESQSHPPAQGRDGNDLQSLVKEEPVSGEAKHPSLEKTEILAKEAKELTASGEIGAKEAGTTARNSKELVAIEIADLALLREQVEGKTKECAALRRTIDGLKTQIEALRNDWSALTSEHLLETRALKEIIQKTQNKKIGLEKERVEIERTQKLLKAQNLTLQYQLSLWGIPVSSANAPRQSEPHWEEPESFFPPLAPSAEGVDPIPVTLRGNIGSFCFPDLLHFLSHSNSAGVLTVLSDTIVSKLYLEKAALRLAGWNDREEETSLAALLEKSQLASQEVLAQFRERSLFDLELATQLVAEKFLPAPTVQSGLKEHARIILTFLFQLKRGSFFFQPGQITQRRDLQFRLPITDVLLKTAVLVDERTKVPQR